MEEDKSEYGYELIMEVLIPYIGPENAAAASLRIITKFIENNLSPITNISKERIIEIIKFAVSNENMFINFNKDGKELIYEALLKNCIINQIKPLSLDEWSKTNYPNYSDTLPMIKYKYEGYLTAFKIHVPNEK